MRRILDGRAVVARLSGKGLFARLGPVTCGPSLVAANAHRKQSFWVAKRVINKLLKRHFAVKAHSLIRVVDLNFLGRKKPLAARAPVLATLHAGRLDNAATETASKPS